MVAEQYQWPLTFRHMPSVYCSGPSHPGGRTSGQRPGPSFFQNSTWTPAAFMSSSVMVVVIGQLARSNGEFNSVESVRSKAAGGGGGGGDGGCGVGVGSGGGAGACADVRCSSSVPCTGPKQVVPV